MNKYLSLISHKTRRQCSAVILLAAAASVLASVWPVLIGDLYTSVSAGEVHSVPQILGPAALAGTVCVLAECLSISRRVLMDCAIASHEAGTRIRSMKKLLRMPVACLSRSLSGETTAELNQGISGLSHLITIFCNDLLPVVLTSLCTILQVLRAAPARMALLPALYLVLTVMISVFQIRSQNGIRERIVREKNAMDGRICQSISNIELIRSLNAAEYETGTLAPFAERVCRTERKHHIGMGSYDALKKTVEIGFQILILLTSVKMICDGRMERGAALSVYLLFQQLIRPIEGIYRFMDESASSVIKAGALVRLDSEKPDPVYSIEPSSAACDGKDIVLEKVLVRDPSLVSELARFDRLVIPAKGITALTGRSGCGKSSLMKAAVRYDPCTYERFTVLGKDLSVFSQQELTDTLLYIPQRSFFFAGTVRENLLYGMSRPVPDEELITVLKKVCLFDALAGRVEESPEEDTSLTEKILSCVIGEGGTGLSGGEGQRISLARAFLRTPGVFVLDESTTGLDDETADIVLSNLESYAASVGAGILYISHDSRVIRRADHIVDLENKSEAAYRAA